MKVRTFFLALVPFAFLLPLSASASQSVGSIDSTYKYARVCHDAACATYGNVNWAPTINASTPGATAISITDSGITGYAWGDEIGWINMSPTGAGVSINPNTGALSGEAWANAGSWINFAPTQAPGGPAVGVTIDSNGQFIGWAWVSGLYGGWMRFDCSSGATCVKTDWRPIPARTSSTTQSTPVTSSNGPPPIQPVANLVASAQNTPLQTPSSVQNPPPLTEPPHDHEAPGVIYPAFPKQSEAHATAAPINQFQPDASSSGIVLPPPTHIAIPPGAPAPISASSGDVEEIFPSQTNGYVASDQCIFCLVVRKADAAGSRNILKWAFVPQAMELPLPIPFISHSSPNAVTHVDLVSATATAVGAFVFIKIAMAVVSALAL